MEDEIGRQLRAPFEEEDIKWRVQTAGVSDNGNPYVMVIPYVSNRAIQKRFDDVFGVFGWENVYQPTPGGNGWLCGITIHGEGRSVTKWDGADNTNIESLKGGLSGAMKRAAVQLGVGRYLYGLKEEFAKCEIVTYRNQGENVHKHVDKKTKLETLISWEYPKLPSWAVPFEDYSHFIKPISEAKDMTALRVCYEDAYKAATASHNKNLMKDATEAKDDRKEYINNNLAKIEQLKVKTVQDWLDGEMGALKEFPSKITVDSHVKRIKGNLEIRAKAENIDPQQFIEILTKAHKARLAKIKAAKK